MRDLGAKRRGLACRLVFPGASIVTTEPEEHFLPDTTAPHGTVIAPAFSGPTLNPYGLVNVGGWSAPTFGDIDRDGDLDAFIGEASGLVQVFINTGTATAPAFITAVNAGFHVLVNTNEYIAQPVLVDIDADGDLDLFVGSLFGNNWFFRNIGTAAAPQFATPDENYNEFGLGSSHMNPTFADLDGDHDLDMIVQVPGGVQFGFNTGDPSFPAFDFEIGNLTVFGAGVIAAAPAFADVDHDGDLDGFCGDYDGDLVFWLNIGSATTPVFAAPVTNPFGLANAGQETRPTFVDIDGDGDLDMFVGNQAGQMQLFLNNSGFALSVETDTPDGTYDTGATITFKVAFSENVFVAGGTPRFLLETGAVDRYATYSGGSGTSTLTFTYIVQAGDTSADLDVTSTAAFALNGATIRDAAGNNAALVLAAPGATGSLALNADLVIDGATPLTAKMTTASIKPIASANIQSNAVGIAYLVKDSVTVTDVTSITLSADSVWNKAAITTPLLDRHISAAGLVDGTYKLYVADSAGNLSAASTGTVIIDSVAPTATLAAGVLRSVGSASVSSSEVGTAYLVNTSVAVTNLASITTAANANWNKVLVTQANTPTALSAAGLVDGSYQLYVTDAAGNLSAASADTVTVDSTAPHDAVVSPASADGTYRAGSTVSFTVEFSEIVNVDTTAGKPLLVLETGAVDRSAVYVGGSGTTTLLFVYTVVAGDTSADLDVVSASALRLHGATIEDAAGNKAVLTLAAPGTSDSLSAQANIVIDGVNDYLVGTASAERLAGGAGADTLVGLAGNDLLVGGAGADTFVFGAATGKDRIADFSVSDGDVLSLLAHANGSNIVDAASALTHLHDVAGNAVLDLGSGNQVTLTGVHSVDLSAANFAVGP
jgi:hypothetical protein